MKAEKQFYVFGVRDSHDNTWIGVLDDLTKKILVTGLKDRDGQGQEFNGEFYHLFDLCPQYGFLCTVTKRTIEVEFPD